jgi:hypothetical protein
MNHGEQIRSLMLKAQKAHKNVNHDIQNMKIEISKNNVVLTVNCFDADGEAFRTEHSADGSVSEALNELNNKF